MKANSERVKGKNFKNFGGKPLFRWILDKLIEIDEIDKIVINTDAREILKAHGLEESSKIIIRDRKKEICGDLVSMNTIIDDDIQSIDSDIYMMTHTTNPLLEKKSIISAIKKYKNSLLKNKADSLFTVTKLQERLYSKNGLPINHDPENLIRTQDLEPIYIENSNLYLFTKDSFKTTNARIGLNPITYLTDDFESTDIDTKSDWEFAEITLEYYKKKLNE
tara:strand:- start:25696 stop:26358 length:663 start_codon:yes stop_codon:yes gene_type:complete